MKHNTGSLFHKNPFIRLVCVERIRSLYGFMEKGKSVNEMYLYSKLQVMILLIQGKAGKV